MKFIFCRLRQKLILILLIFTLLNLSFTLRIDSLTNVNTYSNSNINRNDFNYKQFSIEEIQNQLSNFISNLEKTRKEEGEKLNTKNSMVKINIKSVYDLRSILESYFLLYNNFSKLKSNDINYFKTKLDFFEDNLKNISKNISKNDQLSKSEIEKSSFISKEISSKNKSNFELISEIEGIKNNFENENKKEQNMLKDSKFAQEIEDNINKNDVKKNSNQIIGKILEIYKENQENVKTRLDTTIDQIKSSNKMATLKTHENFLSEKKNSDEYDLKIMDLILENIQFNFKKFKEEVEKKIDSLNKLKKIMNKSNTSQQIKFEKVQAKENLDKNVEDFENKKRELKDLINENDKLFLKRKSLNEKLNKKIMEKKVLIGEKVKNLNSYNVKMSEIENKRNELKKNEKIVRIFVFSFLMKNSKK